jgi:hypothetical protein
MLMPRRPEKHKSQCERTRASALSQEGHLVEEVRSFCKARCGDVDPLRSCDSG